ncbi:hypothetical protein N4P33_04295 [Streptomyces sp. 15-116A]|uniref:hypothetical protein n=1 Tax=Streptomyces sp. 15-116A TaxID=2259035 RepID=UPI0021B320A1|nr:hypothetical protein [Streptomyces sp. 15-116A]MCT7351390.1 hypothetical protein [Streptomyces sp. 15-116A]
MHPETHLALHHLRAAELRTGAESHRLARQHPRTHLRTRLGWTLVELGLRLATKDQKVPTRSVVVARVV